MSTVTNPAEPGAPNHYELSGDELTVSYSTSGIDGRPRMSVSDGKLSFSLVGDEIAVALTALGTEVTVVTEIVPGERNITITLVLPTVHLRDRTAVDFDTVAIATIDLSGATGSQDVPGAMQTYRVTELHGTATLVDF